MSHLTCHSIKQVFKEREGRSWAVAQPLNQSTPQLYKSRNVLARKPKYYPAAWPKFIA
jgi:hypothetical protein